MDESDSLHCAIERADLFTNIGHDVIEKPPFSMGKNDMLFTRYRAAGQCSGLLYTELMCHLGTPDAGLYIG